MNWTKQMVYSSLLGSWDGGSKRLPQKVRTRILTFCLKFLLCFWKFDRSNICSCINCFLCFCYSIGVGIQVRSLDQDSTVISLSAPGLSSSTNRSESSTQEIDCQVQLEKTNKHSKKILSGRKQGIQSPGSGFSLRRSPRFKVY